MPTRPARSLAAAGLVAAGLLTASRAQPPPAFRTGTTLVRLVVVVTDRQGHPIPNLPASAFVVLDRARPVPLASFSAQTTPVDVLVLLDTSASMTPYQPTLVQALTRLLDGLTGPTRPHQVRLLSFGAQIVTLTPWTADPTALLDALAHAQPAGPTPLYTAIVVGAQLVTPRLALGRTAALVILSDGQNTTDLHTEADAIAAATTAGTPLYPIGTSPPPRRHPTRTAHFNSGLTTLHTLAHETGGVFFPAFSPPDGHQLAAWLTSAYLLAFEPHQTPPPPPHTPCPVRVVLPAHPDLLVRTRTTYTLQTPEPRPMSRGDNRSR